MLLSVQYRILYLCREYLVCQTHENFALIKYSILHRKYYIITHISVSIFHEGIANICFAVTFLTGNLMHFKSACTNPALSCKSWFLQRGPQINLKFLCSMRIWQMVLCIILAVRPLLPMFTVRPPDVIHVMNAPTPSPF